MFHLFPPPLPPLNFSPGRPPLVSIGQGDYRRDYNPPAQPSAPNPFTRPRRRSPLNFKFIFVCFLAGFCLVAGAHMAAGYFPGMIVGASLLAAFQGARRRHA